MTLSKLSYLNPQICKVEILSLLNTDSISVTTDGRSMSITPKTGKDWTHIYTTPGKNTFEEESSEELGNMFFLQKLEIMFPGEDSSSLSALANINNWQLIVKFTYTSGTIKVFGDLFNPVVTKVAFSTEKGGRVVSFSRKSEVPAFNFVY